MTAALDRLTTAVQANVSATNALIQAYQAAPGNLDGAINVLAAQVEQNTVDIQTVLGTTPPAPPTP